MLTPSTIVATPSTFAMVNPRQIAVFSQTSGALLYTVPAGKKFVGYIYGNAVAASYSITPSGGAASSQITGAVNVSAQSITPNQLIFIAGTIITTTSAQQINLVGVESDL